ncbi:hypothetical protein CCC_02588 [Paramagnetospirillum magnetotacticum MS-1]|uniref:DUF4242 domain-containing protein n=1 Tax=Paramagnetospirillum magnetotacticum MS-1 TaxID=272627 RepID=A0A0C2YJ50_PARME|nr:DUF4242 domain-containing protein [Paramagnetospirillum magnetotacticum]KIL99799.1 hypothetical protein CCC_02588 [Paramagnetospirillum magnetotacticum MS-1]
MEKMNIFMDTHDRADGTFPAGLTAEQFAGFFAGYQEACLAEGVVLLKVDVGLDAGRAFCLTMARDAEAVRRAHDRVGLPYASITEVQVATPGSVFFRAGAA